MSFKFQCIYHKQYFALWFPIASKGGSGHAGVPLNCHCDLHHSSTALSPLIAEVFFSQLSVPGDRWSQEINFGAGNRRHSNAEFAFS